MAKEFVNEVCCESPDFKVRVLTDENEMRWFPAKDVLRAVGLPDKDESEVDSKVSKLWKARRRIKTDDNFTENVLCLTEQGLYLYLLKTHTPQARAFQTWVAEEVLPALSNTPKETDQSWKELLHSEVERMWEAGKNEEVQAMYDRIVLSVMHGRQEEESDLQKQAQEDRVLIRIVD